MAKEISNLITFNTYKFEKGGLLVDMYDQFNARVGDQGTELAIQWENSKTETKINLKERGLHFFTTGSVGQYLEKLEDNSGFKMSADASTVEWEDKDGAGTLDDGITIAKLPKQFFPQKGIFFGYFGLKDQQGNVFTSVNVWFRVLGGVPTMGAAIPYFVTEFDEVLERCNGKIVDTLAELREKYQAEVKSNEDMSSMTRTALSKLADTVGAIQAQIDAGNVITKQQFDNGIADNHSYIDQKFKEMLDKIGDATPHFIDTANGLKNTYPNGTNGLWVAQDDGNRYVWYNGQWTSFGAYQGQGIKDKYITNRMIADNTIQDNTISTVHLSSIQDSYAFVGEATVWNGRKTDQSVYFDKDNVAWIKKSTEQGDAGILFPVRLPFIPTGGGAAYVDFSYSTVNADGLKDKVDIWIAQNDGTLIKQLWTGPKKAGSSKLKISAADFAQNNYPKDFSLLFAVHGGAGTLDVRVRVSFNADNIELPIRNYQLGKLISTNHPVTGVWDDESWIDASKVRSSNHNLLNDAILWNEGQYDALSFNNDELVKTSGDLSYNSGISVPIEADTSTDQYVQIVYGYHGLAKGVTGVSVYLSNTNGKPLFKELGKMVVADTACTLTACITREMFSKYNLKNSFGIVVGGKASAMFFKKFQVSSLPIERTLPSAISHLHNEIGESTEKLYGQSIGGIGTATKATVDGLTYGTAGVGYDGDNGRLKSIQAYVPAQGTYNFVVGKLDQHNLLVNGTGFTVDLSQGSNNVDMTSRNIQVNNGDIVFMDLSKAGVYTPDGNHPKYLDSMLQDNNHPSTVAGYPGQMFYDANYLVPFSYSVASMNLPQQIEDLKAQLATTKQQLSAAIEKDKKANIISAPNGKSYRLVVANDGSLSALSTIPSNVTIFGNSLTYEHGKIGMAASDSNHDWYHYVTDYIKNKNSNVKINDRTNMSVWESATSTADREKVFNDSIKPLLSADTNLVIIQLGDNVNTAEKKATFAHDTGELLKQIHTVSPKAQVYWIYGWFGNYPEIFTPIQTACDNNGAIGIDIHDLNKSGNTSYVGATRTGLDGSTWQITNPGEAAHPGDKGMKAIADRVISNFDF